MDRSASPRPAAVADAPEVAALLDAFNREYDVATPGVTVLASRLQRLLAGGHVLAWLAGAPASGVVLLTLRSNVWFDGPVGLLDELYVVPGRRGHGIGSALLRAAETAVEARGGELVEVNVDGDDVDARRFYERHGYANHEPDETQPLLYYFRRLVDER